MRFIQDITMVYSWTPLCQTPWREERLTWRWTTAVVENNSHMSCMIEMMGLRRGSQSSRTACSLSIWPLGFSFWINVKLRPTRSLTASVLFTVWIWSMVWSTAVSINTSYTVDIYVPLMENFPFLPVVPLTSSLCSGPLENSAVKLSGSKCQALSLVCTFQ